METETPGRSIEKRFQCDICNRFYATPITLKVHRSQHTADKKELCDFCGASFKTRGQLKIHSRVHTGEKPYKCDKCGKTFAYRESLITHSTTHTNDKPFVCVVCNAKFSCIGNLLKHRKVRPDKCGAESVPIKRIGPRLTKKTLPNLTDRDSKQRKSKKGSALPETTDQEGTERLENSELDEEQMEEAKSPSESIVNTVQKCIRLSVEALEPSLMVQETFHTAESSVESGVDAFSYEETDLNDADEPTEPMAVNDPKEDGYDEESEQLMEVVTTGEGDRTSVYLISYQDGSDELDSLANAVEFDDYESDKLENSIEMMSAKEEDDDNWQVESDQSSYEASESPKTSTKRHTSQSSTKKVNVKLEPPDEETIKRNKELLDEQMRQLHELSNSIDGRYRCKLCPQQYNTLYTMARHLERAHEVQQHLAREKLQYARNTTLKECKYRCKYCDQPYVNAACLTKHLPKHGQDGRLIHKCPCCDRYFATETEQTKHTLEQHRERVECTLCQKLFTKPDCLQRHVRYAHKTKRRSKYICSKCGKSFPSVTSLSDHERANCGTEPIYQCARCEKHYASYSSLKMHQTVHDNVLPYVCGCCGKAFRTKGQLKVHERAHTGERPFECEICSRSFPYRESLMTHRTIHTGVTRHECKECLRKFSCYGNLKKHRQIHHGVGDKVQKRQEEGKSSEEQDGMA
uniref:zinc finger protein 431 n=1 Tax=Anopheles coluzzii TaxID=1518534 RepID=UPI0020FFC0F6|nr:zinc finger protein 431 [Anopheles coluzzii]